MILLCSLDRSLVCSLSLSSSVSHFPIVSPTLFLILSSISLIGSIRSSSSSKAHKLTTDSQKDPSLRDEGESFSSTIFSSHSKETNHEQITFHSTLLPSFFSPSFFYFVQSCNRFPLFIVFVSPPVSSS